MHPFNEMFQSPWQSSMGGQNHCVRLRKGETKYQCQSVRAPNYEEQWKEGIAAAFVEKQRLQEDHPVLPLFKWHIGYQEDRSISRRKNQTREGTAWK